MKKILFGLLFISSIVSGQDIDTIYVRNLSIKARDWAYFMSYIENEEPKDSTSFNRLRKIRNQILSANITGFNQFVNVDSVPGKWVVRMYRIMRNLPAGEAEQLDPTTKINILSKTQVSAWLSDVDCCFSERYTNRRNIGKSFLLDN